MSRKDVGPIVLAGLGLAAAVLAIVDILRVGDTFGYPGSLLYDRYEAYNRRMTLLLVGQVGAVVAFARAYWGHLGRGARSSIYLLLLAWSFMTLGTATEFWLFSDLPYGVWNARSVAFALFFFGALLAALTFLVLGIQLLRILRGRVPLVHLFLIILPLAIALFVGGHSLFIVPALGAGLLAVAVLAPVQTRVRRPPG